jgi:hypothetical protein
MNASDSVRLKTQVTIVGRYKESVKWVLDEAFRASKRGESPTHTSKMVQTTIDYFLRRRRRRKPANILPRSLAWVVRL